MNLTSHSVVALFVYGTLMPGQREAHRLGPVAKVCAAQRRGRLYHLPAGYPALVEDPDGGVVRGLYVELVEPERLTALDAYEGALYARVRGEVVLDGGGVASAWCWCVRAANLPAGARLLPEGRWVDPTRGGTSIY